MSSDAGIDPYPLSTAARAQLLPTGSLRVGINANNRLTTIIGRELGDDLAAALETRAVFVDHPTPGALAAVVGAEWDLAFMAADPEREAAIAFTPPYMEIEATCAVRAESPAASLADLDRQGVRIATGATSAYTLVLRRELHHAELVILSQAEGLKALRAGEVDAAAGLRFELEARAAADSGLRLLATAIARAQQAIAVPRGHGDALNFLSRYVAARKHDGTIAAAIARTGLGGAAVAP